MPFFHYKAIKIDGKKYESIANCNSAQDLRSHVKNEGGKLISWKDSKKKKASYNLSLQESITLFTHLSHMTQMGVSLLTAIEMLDHQINSKNLVKFSKFLVFCLNKGSSLSAALNNNFKNVDPIISALINAAEVSGNYPLSFTVLKDYFTWKKDLKDKISHAVQYPILCLMVVMLTLGFLFLFLVPKMKVLFLHDSKIALNSSTKALFYLHDSLINFSNFNFAPFFGFSFFLVIFLATKKLKMLKIQQDILFRIPGIKNVKWALFQENFFQILYFHLQSNTNLQGALNQTEKTFKAPYIKSKIKKIIDGLDNGYTLSHILQKLKFNPICCQFVYLGEMEGSYTSAFERCTLYLSHRLKQRLQKMVTYLQPTLILSVSFILIWIIYALFYPLYENIITLSI